MSQIFLLSLIKNNKFLNKCLFFTTQEVERLPLPAHLVEPTSTLRGALPILPPGLASLCLGLNIFLPGVGKMIYFKMEQFGKGVRDLQRIKLVFILISLFKADQYFQYSLMKQFSGSPITLQIITSKSSPLFID